MTGYFSSLPWTWWQMWCTAPAHAASCLSCRSLAAPWASVPAAILPSVPCADWPTMASLHVRWLQVSGNWTNSVPPTLIPPHPPQKRKKQFITSVFQFEGVHSKDIFVSVTVLVSVDMVVAKCPLGIYVLMEETGKQNKSMRWWLVVRRKK